MPADARLARQKTHRVKHTKPHLLSLKFWMHQPARHHMVQGSEVRRQYCPRSGTRLEGALPYDAIPPWLPLLAPKIWTGWRPLHIQKRTVHNMSVQQSTKCGFQFGRAPRVSCDIIVTTDILTKHASQGKAASCTKDQHPHILSQHSIKVEFCAGVTVC